MRPSREPAGIRKKVKKLLRTIQVCFPSLLEAKFYFVRLLRKALMIPSEKDFNALSLFPEIENALYLDVGANRGQSADSILLMRKQVRLHLFEPNPLLCDKLRELLGHREGVAIHAFGLGDETTHGALVVPFYRSWMFDGLGSFNEADARNWLKGRIFFYRDECLTLRKVTSQIRRLDDLDLDPFFIKLDIQGFEYRALKGGEQTLRKHRPVLLVESPSDELIRYLTGFGYKPFSFQRSRFVPDARGETNTFFMTEDKASLVRAHIEKRQDMQT